MINPFNMLKGKSHASPEEKMMREQIKSNESQSNLAATAGDDSIDLNQLEMRSDLLKWQQDLGNELMRLRYKLKSYERTENGTWQKQKINVEDETGNVIEVTIPPLANDWFIQKVDNLVDPYLSRNLINSSFSETQVLYMLKTTSNNLVALISNNFDKHDILFEDWDLVLDMVKTVIRPAPFRAIRGWTHRIDNQISKRMEVFAEGRPQQKKSTWGLS